MMGTRKWPVLAELRMRRSQEPKKQALFSLTWAFAGSV